MPDRIRRIVEVHQLPDLVRILDAGVVVAKHSVIEGRKPYRIDRSRRPGGANRRQTAGSTAIGISIGRLGDHVPTRSLAIYQAIGSQLATGARP